MLTRRLLIAVTVAVAAQCVAAQEEQLGPNGQPRPEPYSFSYSADSEGALSNRQETGDANGRITGFYSINGPDGRERRVDYVADGDGYRATVSTNEIGVNPNDTGDARYRVSPPSDAQLAAANNANRLNPNSALNNGQQAAAPIIAPIAPLPALQAAPNGAAQQPAGNGAASPAAGNNIDAQADSNSAAAAAQAQGQQQEQIPSASSNSASAADGAGSASEESQQQQQTLVNLDDIADQPPTSTGAVAAQQALRQPQPQLIAGGPLAPVQQQQLLPGGQLVQLPLGPNQQQQVLLPGQQQQVLLPGQQQQQVLLPGQQQQVLVPGQQQIFQGGPLRPQGGQQQILVPGSQQLGGSGQQLPGAPQGVQVIGSNNQVLVPPTQQPFLTGPVPTATFSTRLPEAPVQILQQEQQTEQPNDNDNGEQQQQQQQPAAGAGQQQEQEQQNNNNQQDNSQQALGAPGAGGNVAQQIVEQQQPGGVSIGPGSAGQRGQAEIIALNQANFGPRPPQAIIPTLEQQIPQQPVQLIQQQQPQQPQQIPVQIIGQQQPQANLAQPQAQLVQQPAPIKGGALGKINAAQQGPARQQQQLLVPVGQAQIIGGGQQPQQQGAILVGAGPQLVQQLPLQQQVQQPQQLQPQPQFIQQQPQLIQQQPQFIQQQPQLIQQQPAGQFVQIPAPLEPEIRLPEVQIERIRPLPPNAGQIIGPFAPAQPILSSQGGALVQPQQQIVGGISGVKANGLVQQQQPQAGLIQTTSGAGLNAGAANGAAAPAAGQGPASAVAAVDAARQQQQQPGKTQIEVINLKEDNNNNNSNDNDSDDESDNEAPQQQQQQQQQPQQPQTTTTATPVQTNAPATQAPGAALVSIAPDQRPVFGRKQGGRLFGVKTAIANSQAAAAAAAQRPQQPRVVLVAAGNPAAPGAPGNQAGGPLQLVTAFPGQQTPPQQVQQVVAVAPQQQPQRFITFGTRLDGSKVPVIGTKRAQ